MRPSAALVLALALCAASAAAAQKQCGGTRDCEKHSACADAKWTDVRCPTDGACIRKSSEVWECMGGSSPTSTPTTRSFPTLTTGRRQAGNPAVAACTCIDVGLNDGSCFKGITDYCSMKSPPANMTLCEAMSGFFNLQNVTAAQVASEFFVRTCALTVPAKPSACACLEGPNTEGCKAATISACLRADNICPALAFGAEADQESQEAYAKYMNANCGGALAAAEVGLNFTDITKDVFMAKYSQGTAAALAVITGQTLPAVILMPPVEIKTGSLASVGASASLGRRRLAQSNLKLTPKVLTRYQIRSSEAEAKAVLERLQLAGENNGEGLYKALAANGVPLKPSFSIQGGPPLVGAVPRRAMVLDRKEPLDAGEIAGIVVGAVGGAAIIGGAAAYIMLSRRKHNAAVKAAREASASGGKAEGGKVVDVHSSAAADKAAAAEDKAAAADKAAGSKKAAAAAAAAGGKAAGDAATEAGAAAADAVAASK